MARQVHIATSRDLEAFEGTQACNYAANLASRLYVPMIVACSCLIAPPLLPCSATLQFDRLHACGHRETHRAGMPEPRIYSQAALGPQTRGRYIPPAPVEKLPCRLVAQCAEQAVRFPGVAGSQVRATCLTKSVGPNILQNCFSRCA